MKRPVVLIALISLLAGFLAGGVVPMPWDRPPGPSLVLDPNPFQGESRPDFNSAENLPLLQAATTVAVALKEQDYAAVAEFVHPERGVTLTPYSTVDFETDRKLTREQIRDVAKDEKAYPWGFEDGRGNLIELTKAQYFEKYVFNADYTQAPMIGVDRLMMSGNALENLTEAYTGCRFVDFCHPGLDPSQEGMDWCSLRLVFAPEETGWYLVGIIHGQWTI